MYSSSICIWNFIKLIQFIDTNWALHRLDQGKYVPENIDQNLCTHIIFAYAVLDPENLVIKPSNPYTDVKNELLYKRVTALRAHGVKVMIAIGGLSDTVGYKYDRLLADENNNRKFIASVMAFVETNHFDGLDIEVSNCRLTASLHCQLNFTYFQVTNLSALSHSIRFRGKILGI